MLGKRNHAGLPKALDVPFRKYIKAGFSHFTISIPKIFRNRIFRFSHLSICGEFFSKQAAEFDLDTDYILDEIMTFDVHMKCLFTTGETMYPGNFKPPNTITTTYDLATEFNQFYETNKIADVISEGAFFDWIDLRFIINNNGMTWKEWVEERMAQTYYGVPFDPAIHANKLPPSAQKVEGSNSYLFPTVLNEENLDNLRFRLNVAPNLAVLFSTDTHLNNMGFSEDILGTRQGFKFILKNDNSENYYKIVGDEPPVKDLTVKANTVNVLLNLVSTSFISPVLKVSIQKRNFFNPEKFKQPMKDCLLEFEKKINIRLGLEYSAVDKRYRFIFPQNENFTYLTFVMETDLSERLGFGLITDIMRRNAVGNPITNSSDLKDARDKSTALGYDTGMIVVSDDNSSSNTTSGISEKVMGILYPNTDGIFLLQLSDMCQDPPTMRIPNALTDSHEFIKIKFKLSRFIDKNEMPVSFTWKVGSYVQGALRGEVSE